MDRVTDVLTDAIVFGVGNYYSHKKDDVKKIYNVLGYIDNSVDLYSQKKYDDGKTILNPARLEEFQAEKIIIMSVKYVDMFNNLIELGVSPDRIIFGYDFSPAYDYFESYLMEKKGIMVAEDKKIMIKYDNNEYILDTNEEFDLLIRSILSTDNPIIENIGKLPLHPISRRYGCEHGTPIDRYYIDKFLQNNISFIRGVIAEIGDDRYIQKYAHDIEGTFILHINGDGKNAIKVDLSTGEGVEENKFDCLICTQTIQFIYDIEAAVSSIVKMLKPGGVGLITANGIVQISLHDYWKWGDYWRVTEMTMQRIAEKSHVMHYEIASYGNVRVAAAEMYGLCVEDLLADSFDLQDEQYPVIVTMKIIK